MGGRGGNNPLSRLAQPERLTSILRVKAVEPVQAEELLGPLMVMLGQGRRQGERVVAGEARKGLAAVEVGRTAAEAAVIPPLERMASAQSSALVHREDQEGPKLRPGQECLVSRQDQAALEALAARAGRQRRPFRVPPQLHLFLPRQWPRRRHLYQAHRRSRVHPEVQARRLDLVLRLHRAHRQPLLHLRYHQLRPSH